MAMTEAWTDNQPIRDKECLTFDEECVMDQVLIMVTIGLLGLIISVGAFIYILKEWDELQTSNGTYLLLFGAIMCGMAAGVSALSLVFGIAKLLS